MGLRDLREHFKEYGARVEAYEHGEDRYFIYISLPGYQEADYDGKDRMLANLRANFDRHCPSFDLLAITVGPSKGWMKQYALGHNQALIDCFDTLVMPGDELSVGTQYNMWVNQGIREATVLAEIGDERLIEYAMPKGTSSMLVLKKAERQVQVGPKTWFWKSRHVSYASLPKKWGEAMKQAGSVWIGVRQGHRHLPSAPLPYK